MGDFFLLFINMLFHSKSVKLGIFCNFAFGWHFLNVRSPCINKQLFRWKLAKFVSNCKIWIFSVADFFECVMHIYVYFHKYAIVSPKIVKICDYCQYMNFFHGWCILNVQFFLQKYVIILLKIGKIRYFSSLVVEM